MTLGVVGACSYADALDYLSDVDNLYRDWLAGGALGNVQLRNVVEQQGLSIRVRDGIREGIALAGDAVAQRAEAAGVVMTYV